MDLVRQSGQYAQSERLSLLQTQLEQLGLDNAPAQQRAEEAYQALREYAADNGVNLSGGALLTKLRKAGNMTYDRDYAAPKMKFYGN